MTRRSRYTHKRRAGYAKRGSGWWGEPERHADAARGIKTGRKQYVSQNRTRRHKGSAVPVAKPKTYTEKEDGMKYYRNSTEARRDRDLELIRQQQDEAIKQKNTKAMARLQDKENIIIAVNMEKLDEQEAKEKRGGKGGKVEPPKGKEEKTVTHTTDLDKDGLPKCTCGMPAGRPIPGIGSVREHTKECPASSNHIILHERRKKMSDVEFNMARGMTKQQAEHYVVESKRTGMYCPHGTPLLHDDASCSCFIGGK